MKSHVSAASLGKMPPIGALVSNSSGSVHSSASGPRSSVVPAGAFSSANLPAFGALGSPLPSFQRESLGEWLDEALEELSGIDNESNDEGFPLCSERARINAKLILQELAGITSVAPLVYPTSDQEVAIQFRVTDAASSVLLLCDSSGSGACFSYIEGKSQRARFDDALDLPNGFAKAALLRINASQR